jgi:hypothetical protein
MPDIEVTPKAPMVAPAAPAPDPQNNEGDVPSPDASGETKEGIPQEVLAIPAMQAILAGQPAAVSAPITEFEKRPEAKLIMDHKDVLIKAGFGLYRSLSGDIGVLFNSFHIHPEELKQADQAGQLQQVAPSFDQVNDSVAKSGADHPILKATTAPGGPKPAPMPSPPQMGSPVTSPAPAAVQTKLSTARTRNLMPGAPTSGPQPGAGRLLNSILKPVL